MGSHYEFTVDFGQRISAAERFEFIASKAAVANSPFESLERVAVYDYEIYSQRNFLRGSIIAEQMEIGAGAAIIDCANKLANDYRDGVYSIESAWKVKRYGYEDGQTIQEEDVAIFFTFDRGFESWMGRRTHSGVVYDVGNYLNYRGSLHSLDYTKNIELVADELKFIADMGAQFILGTVENGDNPKDCPAIYHRNLHGFLEDFREIDSDLQISTVPTVADVTSVIESQPEFGFRIPDQGILVYSKLGTEGNLQPFYEGLRRLLLTQGQSDFRK